MGKGLGILLAAALLVGASGCSSQIPVTGEADADGLAGEGVKIGLVCTGAGLGDAHICDMVFSGLLQAREELGITFDYVEPESDSDYYPSYRMFAASGEYDLIIGISAEQIDAVQEVGAEFPDQKITLLNPAHQQANVSSLFTLREEQAFLSGVLAGLGTMSDMEKVRGTGIVGVMLGREMPILMSGVTGFEAGVRYVNPECRVLYRAVGDFNAPIAAKELARSMYAQGADFIQCLAGGSDLGIFQAAKDADRYVLGEEGNQNGIAPDHIVATTLRSVDRLIVDEIRALVEGTWTDGVKIFGLADGILGLETEGSNVEVPAEILAVVAQVEQMILDGELVPCGDAAELEDWLLENQWGQ